MKQKIVTSMCDMCGQEKPFDRPDLPPMATFICDDCWRRKLRADMPDVVRDRLDKENRRAKHP